MQNDFSCLHCVISDCIDWSDASVDLNDTSMRDGAQNPILSRYESLIHVIPVKLRIVPSLVRYLLMFDSVITVEESL
jgi:hypothetical protein